MVRTSNFQDAKGNRTPLPPPVLVSDVLAGSNHTWLMQGMSDFLHGPLPVEFLWCGFGEQAPDIREHFFHLNLIHGIQALHDGEFG